MFRYPQAFNIDPVSYIAFTPSNYFMRGVRTGELHVCKTEIEALMKVVSTD
jgi:hypothetical protein